MHKTPFHKKYFRIDNIAFTTRLSMFVTMLLVVAIMVAVNRSIEEQNAQSQAESGSYASYEELSPTPTIEVFREPTASDPNATEIPEDTASTVSPTNE